MKKYKITYVMFGSYYNDKARQVTMFINAWDRTHAIKMFTQHYWDGLIKKIELCHEEI